VFSPWLTIATGIGLAMATIYNFEELEIWKLAFAIYKKVSTLAERMRAKHDYRFADQMKSAAGSVMDNIAEGFERNGRLEFVNSLGIAKGECGELKSQLYRSLSDRYISQDEFSELYEDTDLETRKISSLLFT